MTDAATQQLAARFGIVESFEDARGATRVTAAETRIALLAAMGISARDATEAREALARLDAAEWARPLPSVAVVSPQAAIVPLTLAAGVQSVAWRLVLENGTERRGGQPVEALPRSAPLPCAGPSRERREWDLGAALGPLPLGYHRLSLDSSDASMTLIVSPGRCWLPPALVDQRRLWGVAAQLYLLRSAHNWGIGDFSDLKALTELLRERGADVVGLNPLHALFVDDPEEASPYAPASRLLLNVLNIDVAAVPEFAKCAPAQRLLETPAFRSALFQCRAADQLDYATVARLKLEILELLFADFDSEPRGSRREAFEDFRRACGMPLDRGSLFFALREHFTQGPAATRRADWRTWPDAYRDPDSPTVLEFAREHARRVTFYAWLQFLADFQLGEAAQAAASMAVGLYRDLAVGAHAAGAETWANRAAVAQGVQVGAPPDVHNPAGQSWGLPPFNPRALREEGYRSFIELLRANMRHAGGLRIDHVMGLQQLYLIPDGKDPAEGAYVRYPIEDLLGILALESQRQRCLVVGEDLGTVPAGLRERLAAAAVLSYRVIFFEQDAHGYIPAEGYPNLAVAVAGSHDLPTILGWWRGVDVDLKERLGLYPTSDGAAQARATRCQDKDRLLAALQAGGWLESAGGGSRTLERTLDDETLLRAIHAFLAASRAALAMVQIDDLAAEIDQVNVPATSREHPNWRRRQSMSLERLARHPRLELLAGLCRAAHRGAVAPSP